VKRFLLDTNVVSETNRRAPSSSVIAWLESVPLHAIFISAVTVGELFVGARAVPHGRRHNELDVWLQGIVASQYAGRILAFDVDAAKLMGDLMASARASGNSPSFVDAQIAATASLHALTVATRNVRHFVPLAVPVLNPWDYQPSVSDG
jgi:predicted nucleic acid-binding protein